MATDTQQQSSHNDGENEVTQAAGDAIAVPLFSHSPPKTIPKAMINKVAGSTDEPDPEDVTTDVIVVNEPLLVLESAEHDSAGLGLMITNPQTNLEVVASSYSFKLTNGLKLRYDDINWLAGDFYGTDKPVSDNVPIEQGKQRFLEAFWTLNERPESKAEVEAIQKAMQDEVDGLNKAIKNKTDPSKTIDQPGGLWSSLTDTLKWDNVTSKREAKLWDGPSGSKIKSLKYSNLLNIDYDHFGQDGRKAYEIGHLVAMETAAKGNLELAYCQNPFADHFLQDAFSSGHLRTPRRIFRDGSAGGLCANAMHNEDSALGLTVVSPNGSSWTCYGDGRFYDADDAANVKHLQAAQQMSVDEVTAAFNQHKVPDSVNGAWNEAPTLASALDTNQQKLAALFKIEDGTKLQMRTTIAKQLDKQWEVVSTTDANFALLWAEIKGSGALEAAMDTVNGWVQWGKGVLDLS